jgi:hypothetical protein
MKVATSGRPAPQKVRLHEVSLLQKWQKRAPVIATSVLLILFLTWVWEFGPAAASPPSPQKGTGVPAPTPAESNSDNAHRWVAVIYDNIPVTREELGDYLIARHSDKLELLVNKKIIEHACKEKGIDVTAAEVDAALAEDLKGMNGITPEIFVNKVLKQYNKTLYEWKEDVLRPKIAMSKLCQSRVQITDKDYQDAFEAYYGEKVECRIVLFPKGEEKHAMTLYADMRKSDEEFDRLARQQASPTLAASGGRIRPISRHSTANDELEKEAFSLQPGELSRLIGTPEGTVVLKCVRRIPPDKSKNLETERANLQKEIMDKKVQAEIPKVFAELREQAKPKLFLKKSTSQEDLERAVKQELQQMDPAKKAPHAN